MNRKTTIVGVAVLLLAVTGVALAVTSGSLSDGDPEWNRTSSQSDMNQENGEFVLQTKSESESIGGESGEAIEGEVDQFGAHVVVESTNSDGEMFYVHDSTWGPNVDTEATVNGEFEIIDSNGDGDDVWEIRDGSGTLVARYTSTGTKTFTYNDTDGDLDLRIYGYNVEQGDEVAYLTTTHSYEARDGTLQVTDNGSYMELSEIASLGTLSVNGTDNSGSSIDFRVERRSDGNTICEVEGVDGFDVNLQDACSNWDPSNPDNSYLKFYFDVTRDPGATGDTIDDWTVTYDEQTDVPQVQSKSAVIGGYETQGDSGSSYVGSNDEFVVEDMDRDIQEVQWYINGERVQRNEVSGQGPFSLNHEWESGGTYYVRADLYSTSTGTIGTTSWTVDVDEISINGKDSFTVPTGQSFELQQTFESNTDESIEVTIQSDGEVVNRLSGPETTTIGDGNSVTWEFLMEEGNYNGQPITIVAESGDNRVTKQITVSSTEQGGALFASGDDQNRIVIIGGVLALLGIGIQYFYGLPKLLGQIFGGLSGAVRWVLRKVGGVL